MTKHRRLVAGLCPGCGHPLLHATKSKKECAAYCPECWGKVATSRDLDLSLELGLVATRFDAVIVRVSAQRNTTVLNDLRAANAALRTIADDTVLKQWRI